MTEHDLNTASELTRLREVNAELLDACKAFHMYFYRSGQSINLRWESIPPTERKHIVDKIRAAIAKAEGSDR